MSVTTVLVIGATGHVGRQVVPLLLKRAVTVRALVRPGSDASALEAQGVTVVRGDMMNPESLDAAFAKADAVISCAAGYTRRRKSDSAETDRIGNANLARAAKSAATKRYVLNSILQCDDAPDVPHFSDKAFAESELRAQGVPFVALRPGAFLDQSNDFTEANTRKNAYMGMGDSDRTRWSWVFTPDLAQGLVNAVFADPGAVGKTIDVGWSTGPVTNKELADAIAKVTGRMLKRTIVPWWVLRAATVLAGPFSKNADDLARMFLYFRKGRYVADLASYYAFLGPAPTMEDAVRRWAEGAKLVL
jgi:uncharacterized protein YbjT (DUF2867 family)